MLVLVLVRQSGLGFLCMEEVGCDLGHGKTKSPEGVKDQKPPRPIRTPKDEPKTDG
jgi:hypothetical protein